MSICENIMCFSIGFVRFDRCDYMLEEFPWLLEIKLWWIDYLC